MIEMTILIIIGVWGSILLIGEVLKGYEKTRIECLMALDDMYSDTNEENKESEEN